jgi:hypothetical protein
VWILLLRPSAPLSSTAFRARSVQTLVSQIEQTDRRIEAVSLGPVEPNRLLEPLKASGNLPELEQLLNARIQLLNQLEQEFEVRIPSGANEQSGVDRYFTDEQGTRSSGYYLILSAISSDGRPVSVPVRDLETGIQANVPHWGERVPEEIYNRVRDDKLADAIVDDNLFAVKKRGRLDWEILFKGSDGQPLKRIGQILDIPR